MKKIKICNTEIIAIIHAKILKANFVIFETLTPNVMLALKNPFAI